MKPFKSPATFGEVIALASDHSVRFTFKFFGHEGVVIAQRVVPVPGRPLDVIGRQREFVRLPH